MARDLVMKYRPIGEIQADPRNARAHPKKQIAQLVASIRAFGFTAPCLVDEQGVLIAGHGRAVAAKQLGLASIPTIEIAGLSDTEKRALRLADNRIALNSSWNVDLLRVELEAISSAGPVFDVTLTGFSAPEVDFALSVRAGRNGEILPKPKPPVPLSRLGDIWLLGDHRVACGDCRDDELMVRLMAGDRADAAFLDPPYNVPISGFAVGKGSHIDFKVASGEMSKEQFVEFLRETLGVAARYSRNGAVHFCAMDWRHIAELMEASQAVYGELLNLCVWNKSNAGMGSLYRSKHELVFVLRVGDAHHYNAVELGKNGRHRSNVWDYASVNTFNAARRDELALHPTVKPCQLVADALMDVTRRGEVVIDLFLGSGTSLVAAEQIGRKFRGVELDPGYVDVAIDRWARTTCREPVLEATGQTRLDVRDERLPEAV